VAFRLGGAAIVATVEFHLQLVKQLWLAVDEVIHDDDIQIGRLQDSISRGDSHHKNAGCVKPDSQEGKAPATVRSGQHVPAKQQITVNIKVFDLRAVVVIDVGEHNAEPFDRCCLCSSGYEKQIFRNGAIQGGEELLWTERAKQRWIDTVDISKSDRSVSWVHQVGAYLKACPWSEEYDSARRVAVKEIRRQQVRCGASVWNRVPVDLAAAMGKCAAYSVVGSEIAKIPESVYRSLDIRRRGAGRFEYVRIS